MTREEAIYQLEDLKKEAMSHFVGHYKTVFCN